MDRPLLSAIEDLNRSIDTIGLLLFGQRYPDTLDELNRHTDATLTAAPGRRIPQVKTMDDRCLHINHDVVDEHIARCSDCATIRFNGQWLNPT